MLLADKTLVITGVANSRSIAWGMAKACDAHGARLCLTYQNERLLRKIQPLLSELNQEPLMVALDVSDPDSLENLTNQLKQTYGSIHGLVHAIAFADREDLQGRFHQTSRSGFSLAHDISAYSLIALTTALKPLLSAEASVLCLSYLGGERVFPSYNVMGVAKASLEMAARYLAADLGADQIRVNILSPGPIKTLAAAGVSGFSSILATVEQTAPLRRNVTPDDVAGPAVFLLSDLSRGVTGETIHVDSGFHIMGISPTQEL